MSTDAPEQAPKKQARVVVPFRVSPAGKDAMIQTAKNQGYDQYTEWIRDVLAREVAQPRVRKGNR